MSLREQCKERLKVAFDSIRAISSSLTFILVVDDTSLKVISSTIKMMELVNYGINSIERLQLKRKKFKNIEAVYMIHPDSYPRLVADFQKQPQYGSIHILTLSKIPNHILNELSNMHNLAKRVKTLKQLNFNFVLYGENQFIIQKAGQNYSKSSIIGNEMELQKVVSTTVEQLCTVVTSLSEFYIVEILYTSPIKSNLAQRISIELKLELQKMFEIYSKFNIQNYTSSAPQTTFLILDRCYDAITPLIRDFHYFPLLYDENDCYKHRIEVANPEKKTYIMDENDTIFQKFKNQHIFTAFTVLTQDFSSFSRQHVGAKFQKNQQGTLEFDEMAKVMKKIPQYNQLKDKYRFHLAMLENIGQKIAKKDGEMYKEIGEVEQKLASQVSDTGKNLKSTDLFQQVIKTIDLSKKIKDSDKVRLILIALLTLQLKPKQKQTLQSYLKNIGKYSQIYQKMQSLTGHLLYKMGPKKNKQIILERHQPKIQDSFKKISEGGQADLKYLRVGTEARGKSSQKSSLVPLGRRKIGVTNEKTVKPRLIVFFCTAISYSQIRALAAFEKDYHIIYGSHSFTTQRQFLDLVNSLQQDQL